MVLTIVLATLFAKAKHEDKNGIIQNTDSLPIVLNAMLNCLIVTNTLADIQTDRNIVPVSVNTKVNPKAQVMASGITIKLKLMFSVRRMYI